MKKIFQATIFSEKIKNHINRYIESIRKDKSLLLLIIILLVSFLIRVSLIDNSFYYGHPDLLFRPAESFVSKGNFPEGYGRVGLTDAAYGPILVYLFSTFLLVWNDIHALYFFSITLVCITTLFVYKFCREFFGIHAGLIASIFVSFHALSLFATTDNSNGVFAAPFIAMFIYSLFKIKFKEDTKWWILCFFSIGFLLQIHISVFICVFILAAFLFFRPKLNLKYISIGFLILILLFLPYMIHQFKTGFRDIRVIYDFYFTNRMTTYGLTENPLILKVTDSLMKREEIFDTGFSKISIIGLAYFVFYLGYNYFKREHTETVKKYSLLLMMFTLSYLWLVSFPYIQYYHLIPLLIIISLINAEFLNSIINLFLEMPLLIALLYLILFFWMVSNIYQVNNILNGNKVYNGIYFKLEKQVAETILKHSPKDTQEKLNLTDGDYRNYYSGTSLDNLFYYGSITNGRITRYYLKKEKWYPPDRNTIYLIMSKKKLPFTKVESVFSEEIDDYVLINFENEIKVSRFSTEYYDNWYLEAFNDSNWQTALLPIHFCKVTDKTCILYWEPEEIPQEDFFLRHVLTNNESNSDKIIFITPHSEVFVSEIYINGAKVYSSRSFDAGEHTKTFELADTKKYWKHGENIVGVHLKQRLNVDDYVNVFVLTEER